MTGNGWPAQAKRSHKLHEEYAKKTLYAYMPCAGVSGTEYIDTIVRESYGGRYGELLLDFVNDRKTDGAQNGFAVITKFKIKAVKMYIPLLLP